VLFILVFLLLFVFIAKGSFYLSAYLLYLLLILVSRNLILVPDCYLFRLQDIFLSLSCIGLSMSIAVSYNNIKQHAS